MSIKMMGMEDDELLRIGQVADLVDVAPNTIRNWRYRGTGPPGFPMGFLIGHEAAGLRWYRSEVEAWIKSRHATQTKATA